MGMLKTHSRLEALEERVKTLELEVNRNRFTQHYNVQGNIIRGYNYSQAVSVRQVLLMLLKHLKLRISQPNFQVCLLKIPKRKDTS